MNKRIPIQPIHPPGEDVREENLLIPVETFGGQIHIEWDLEAEVTPMGQLSFIVDFLKTAQLYDSSLLRIRKKTPRVIVQISVDWFIVSIGPDLIRIPYTDYSNGAAVYHVSNGLFSNGDIYTTQIKTYKPF